MKKSELMRKALKYLWGGDSTEFTKTPYICNTFYYCRLYGKQNSREDLMMLEASREIIKEIYALLGEYETLSDYVRFELLDGKYPPEAEMQAFRKRWMLHLIEQYELKGE